MKMLAVCKIHENTRTHCLHAALREAQVSSSFLSPRLSFVCTVGECTDRRGATCHTCTWLARTACLLKWLACLSACLPACSAKEIKTHVVQNMGTVESHISDYQRIIDNLQAEVVDLRAALSEQQTVAAVAAASPSSRPRTAEDDLLSIISKYVSWCCCCLGGSLSWLISSTPLTNWSQ